jgi:hypothetical protein
MTMTDQTTADTITLELTEDEVDYLVLLLNEEGRSLPRRPSILLAILRKLVTEHA